MPRAKNPAVAIEMAERDRRIVELKRAGWHYQDLAHEFNLSPARCCQIVKHWLANIPEQAAAEWRETELDLLGRGIRELLARAANCESDRNFAELWREVRMHGESRRKLLGTDSPAKRELAVLDGTSEDAKIAAEIRELEAQMRQLDNTHHTDG
jgi:hypothetical protein